MLTQGFWDILIGSADDLTAVIEVKNSRHLDAGLARSIVQNALASDTAASRSRYLGVASQSRLFLWNLDKDSTSDREPDQILDMTPIIDEFAPTLRSERIPGRTLVSVLANWISALQSGRLPQNVTERTLADMGFTEAIIAADVVTWITS